MQIYTSEKRGSDTAGNGTEEAPLKTVLQAIVKLDGKIEADTRIWVDGTGDEMWDVVSKSKLKKATKQYHIQTKKQEKAPHEKIVSYENGDNVNLSEAINVQLTLDTKLPEAKELHHHHHH
uniref:Asparagine--tRNA ligase n=1 Tax=Schistosoma japonicum TaxID=6182 RepID=UPI002800724D|nr:Chain A, Asparagine--tRNA ligase [Schistosoma japonicum]